MTLIRLVMISVCFSASIAQSYASNINRINQNHLLPNTQPLLIKKEIAHNKNLSFIEQTLNKQKQQLNLSSNISHDDVKIMTTLHTQNFLAAQHQSFSRFIQNFFSPHES